MNPTSIIQTENYWKAVTLASNEAFDKGNFNDALLGYKDALTRAEKLNNVISDCMCMGIPLIQVYVISCNNLANTYEELQQYNEAERMLKRVVYFLLYYSEDKSLDTDEIQSELKKATLTYIGFAEKNHLSKICQEQMIRELKEQFCD